MIVAGIGCRTGVSAEAILALLDDAVDLGFKRPDILAVPDFRSAESGIRKRPRRWACPSSGSGGRR